MHRSDGAADGRRNVIVARGDIGHERSQYIERCPVTDGLLHLHIRRDLIHRHMSRSFDHDLHILLPGALRELPKPDQLSDLRCIRRIGKAPRPAGITKRDRHIIFPTDIENLIEVFIKRILLPGHGHPREDQ